MKYSIWGTNRFGRTNQCFATYVPPSEVDEYIERAKKEGWKDLAVNKKPQPMLFGDEWDKEEPAPKRKRGNNRKGVKSP